MIIYAYRFLIAFLLCFLLICVWFVEKVFICTLLSNSYYSLGRWWRKLYVWRIFCRFVCTSGVHVFCWML